MGHMPGAWEAGHLRCIQHVSWSRARRAYQASFLTHLPPPSAIIDQTMAAVDVLTATATQLSQRLQAGSLTSVDLVQAYLAQIEKHNHAGLGLRALIAVHPPTALGQAADRDRERAQGRVRSPLHGIPIIVKDAVITAQSLGLPTTAGAVAFRDTYGKQNAAVIDLLLDQGLIILGKASMTEFCGLKAFCMTAGWSAINGLTQSAWIEGGFRPDDLFIGRSGPGGSSSGSGVGVSAGFAPLSIGTETAGSICMPANRAGLYSMAATRGTIPVEGVFRLSRDFDRLGGMAKCPEDLALLMQVLNGTRAQPATWADIAVGFVDPLVWNAFQFQKERDEAVEKQIVSAPRIGRGPGLTDQLDKYEWARNEIVQRGGRVVYPVELPAMEDLRYEGKSVSHSVACESIAGREQTHANRCSL